ncbi:penicillin-binding protein 2 [Thermovirga lienii]|uniref:penicillin-binding protein 2 n=1 Tax=Thermovirga lienii TaxID=336261 RepID=UPI002FDF79C3
MPHRLDPGEKRIQALLWLVLFSISLLVLALFRFQILQSDKYINLAAQNRLRFIRLPPSRGDIVDANGAILATSMKVFDLIGYPQDLLKDESINILERVFLRHGIPFTKDKIKATIKKQYSVPYNAVTVLSNLTIAQVSDLVSDPEYPEFLYPLPVMRRVYPTGNLLPHVLGYVGEITKEELESLGGKGYRGGDIIGKAGVELIYEDQLRGEYGEEAIEVDARGRRVRVVDRKEPVPGDRIALTIDLNAQSYAASLLGDRKGVVFAMDVRNGDVKVLYSYPGYDPNALAWGLSSKEWALMLKDKDKPMMNRTISGTYPPASTYKLLTAYAALAEKKITPSTTYYCPGAFKLGNRTFRCWKTTGHGTVNLEKAIRESCDVYFYQVGLKTGIDAITFWSRKFGLGSPTGIDLPGEASGLVADPVWKKRVFNESWYPGDTVNYSIGQGFLLTTPIQMARVFAAIANGGKLVRPRLYAGRAVEVDDLGLSDRFLKILRNALYQVVKSGTGRLAGGYGVEVSGKTGTAQNPHGEDHAWFVGYAPSKKPEYVAVALVEGGGHGSSAAAPIVGQVLSFLCRGPR